MLSAHDTQATRSLTTISNDQAANIIHHHFDKYRDATIQVQRLPGTYQHHADSAAGYLIDVLHPSGNNIEHVVCFLILSTPGSSGDDDAVRSSNSLPTIQALSNLIRDNTDIPIPVHYIDLSLSIIPYHYLLSSPLDIPEGRALLSLSEARQKGVLSPQEHTRLDLRIGQYLGQLHTNVQNEWFGMPQPRGGPKGVINGSTSSLFAGPPGGDSAYSWQETFLTLFEHLLDRVEGHIKKRSEESQITLVETNGCDVNSAKRVSGEYRKHTLPSQDIHRSLSRAISFFLFDDAQVPSLVTHTWSADDIFIYVAADSKGLDGLPPITVPVPDPEITYVLPNLWHALWGDPLLEAIFTPGLSQAMHEGYNGAGGGELIVFPRQKTKRLWYTLFSALLVLAEEGVEPLTGKRKAIYHEERRDEVEQAWETVEECVRALKDAPCY